MIISLSLKRPKSTKSVIYTQFTKNNEHYKLYSGKSILTENWSIKKEVVLTGEDNFELINEYLKVWVQTIKDIFESKLKNKERINQDILREELKRIFNKNNKIKKEFSTRPIGSEYLERLDKDEEEIIVSDFTSYMRHFLKLKKNDNKHLQKLQQAQKSVLIFFNLITKKKATEYEKLTIKQKSCVELVADYKLPFEEINLKLIKSFKSYLNNATYKIKVDGLEIQRHYKTNYIDKQINGLKQFINGSIEDTYVKPFTWDSVKSDGNEVDTVHTDFKEIQAISDVILVREGEDRIRDKYVINCFLGLRYSDFNSLDKHEFKYVNVAGEEILIYSGRNKKTDALVEFPVHPIAAQKLKKYDFQIPKCSAKEFNAVIKIIAEKAGLTELIRIREERAGKTTINDIPKFLLICSHTGRRSFCTNFYVEGIAIAIIMSISGHKTEKDFRKYIKKNYVRIEVAAQQIFSIKGIDISKVA